MDPIIGGALLGLGGDILGSLLGGSAQREANRQNVKNQREQRAWEEKMANSAVQRRADDIEKAGFNRLLAATGAGASSPSVSPATAQPTFRPEWTKGGGANALVLGEQLRNMRASTENIEAQTQGQKIKNNIDNVFAPQLAALNMDLKTLAKQKSEKEYDLLETNIANAIKTGMNLQLTGAQTAAQTGQIGKMVELLIQQIRAGKLELDALENIAKIGGIEANKTQGVWQNILTAVKLWMQRKN